MQSAENNSTEVTQSPKQKSSKAITISIVIILVCAFLVLGVLLLSLNNNKSTSQKETNIEAPKEKAKTETEEGVYSIKLVSVNNGGGNALYLVNPSKQENILISDKVVDASLSPDNKIVAYIDLFNDTTILNIYNIESKQTSKFDEQSNIQNSEGELFSGISWSPNSAYLLLAHGTYVIKTIDVIDFNSKQLLSAFSTSEFGSQQQYYWVDSSHIVFMHVSNIEDSDNKIAGSGRLTAISMLNVVTGEKKDLLSPKKGYEYALTDQAPVDNLVKVSKLTYNGAGVIQKTELIYLNVDTGETSPVSAPQ